MGKRWKEPLGDSERKMGPIAMDLELEEVQGGCWRVLNKAHTNTGYAVMSINGVMITVGRYLYKVKKNSELTRDVALRRTCGHRWCVNPDHFEEVRRVDA